MAQSHQVKKVAWWHESVVDWLLKNPEKNQGECARHFDVSESYLSILMNSDAFMAYHAQRREEHNSNVSKSVIERVEEVASVSLEVLEERIKREKDTIGLKTVNDTCAMALKALGFGAKQPTPGNTQNVIMLNAATPEGLAHARENMRLINQIPEENKIEGAVDGNTLTPPLPATS